MERKQETPSLKGFLRDFRQLIWPYRRMSWQATGMSLLVQIFGFVEPLVMMLITNQLIRNARHAATSLPFYAAVGYAALCVVHVLRLAQRRIGRQLTIELERSMYVGCLEKLLALPHGYHLRHNTGESIGTVTRGNERVCELVWHLNYDFLPALCLMTVTIGVLLWADPRIAGIIIVAVIAYTAMLTHVTKKTRPLGIRRHDLWKAADESTGQAITNVMTVQAFSQEQREIAAIGTNVDANHRIFVDEFRLLDRTSLWRNSTTNLVRIGILILCAFETSRGRMSVGAMAFTVVAVDRAFNHLYELAGIYERFLDCVEPVQRIIRLLNEPDAFADAAVGLRLGKAKGDIRFENVGYAYAPDQAHGSQAQKGFALRNLSLHIEAGEMIGIAGESGHGKSTLAKLLMRFMDPDAGAIYLDDVDIRSFVLADYRRAIGYVPQEVEIFNATIAENIRYAVPEATDEDVRRAAMIAGAHDFIRALDQGYGTLVGNRGLRLSGGQRQRIGIARAVIGKPSILIFDEATNSLDAVSIQKIMQAMAELRGSCTIIVISHQLSTIQHADRIVVMERGELAEIGTHEQLLKENGLYHKLVHIQQQAEAML